MRSKKNLYRDDQSALILAALEDGSADPDFELKERLKNLLAFEEGKIVLPSGLHVAYKDSKGILTIGYGFNLEDGSASGVLRQVTTKTISALKSKVDFLTEQEARALLFISEEVALRGVRQIFPDYARLDLPRRIVLAAMVYQMGSARFMKFRRLIAAVMRLDWPGAVQSMVESQWCRKDSPKRAHRMAEAMSSGTFPPNATVGGLGSGGASATSLRAPRTRPLPPPAAESPVTLPPARRSPWPFDN